MGRGATRRWRRAFRVSIVVGGLALLLSGCGAATADEEARLESAIAELDGVTGAQVYSGIPGFFDDLEPEHSVRVRLTVGPGVSSEELDRAVLGASEIIWRARREQVDIDFLEVNAYAEADDAGASSPLVTLADVIDSNPVPRAWGLDGRRLTACQAWATFGDRTDRPYRSTTQWAVSGCDREVTVVLPEGVTDHPSAPWSVHLRDVAPVLVSIALLVLPVYGLVVWSRRGRARRAAETAPPPPTGRPHPTVVDGYRWTTPPAPPPPPPPPRS